MMQSKCIQELKGFDGLPFASDTPGNVRICFGLFIDWFNANRNTIRGSKHGTGGIYLIILNLPESMRFDTENMFHVFIPGPKEPNTEQLCNVIRPMVNELITLFEKGLGLHTSNFSIFCFAMLALIIADLKAAKKIGGYAAHNQNWFCALCRQQECDFRTHFDPDTWPPMLLNTVHRQLMNEWRQAQTLKDRKAHFRLNGIRYSELERLKYLDFSRTISLEPMHALHNIIEPHIRRIFRLNAEPPSKDSGQQPDGSAWGILGDDMLRSSDFDEVGEDQGKDTDDSDLDNSDPDEMEPDQQDSHAIHASELSRGQLILRRPFLDWASVHLLKQLSVSTLQELCSKRRISFFHMNLHKGKPLRSEMVEALITWVIIYSSLCH